MRKFILSAALVAACSAYAAGSLQDLKIFNANQLGKGLWRVELLSSSDQMIANGANAMGKVGICMDVAEKLSKESELDENQCKPHVVTNTASVAEVNVTCNDGQHGHLKLSKESASSFLIDSDMTDASNNQRSITARYQYEGACQGDNMIQMDKNSTACQMMGQMDMTKMAAMCANAPADYRAQCEEQMKSMTEACQ